MAFEQANPKEEAAPNLLLDHKDKDVKTKYDQSLFKAIIKTFFFQIWTAGLLKLLSGKSQDSNLFLSITLKAVPDTLKTTTPLLTKVLLTWLSDSYVYFRLTDAERTVAATQGLSKPQGLGYGIGLAFALFIMQGKGGIALIHVTFF